MLVNADFSRRAMLLPEQYQWVASPQPGVERVMLDRIGGEQARATSIVRYAAASIFPPHPHPGGEEILVLSGTFSEGDEAYPAGWYLRNPPGSSHQPSSPTGATLFVKLGQMPLEGQRRVRIDTRQAAAWQHQPERSVCPLFADATGTASLQRVSPFSAVLNAGVEGAELLVLAGEINLDDQPLPRGGWLRLPGGEYPQIRAGAQGATLYLKLGRLGYTAPQS